MAYKDPNDPRKSAASRRYRDAHPERMRETQRAHDLKRHYGITVEQYDAMLSEQGGVCAICGAGCVSGKRLAVDHDHTTGAVRALLCINCNRGIGYLMESESLLTAAIDYLRRYQC